MGSKIDSTFSAIIINQLQICTEIYCSYIIKDNSSWPKYFFSLIYLFLVKLFLLPIYLNEFLIFVKKQLIAKADRLIHYQI